MTEWCEAFQSAFGGLAVIAAGVVSWALDEVPGLREWWEARAGVVKRLIYAAVCVGLGFGAWGLGLQAGCPDWPTAGQVSYIVAVAAMSFLAGGYRHERAKHEG